MPHDAVVIGAGMAGLSAAVGLVLAGRDVIVLEARGRIGGRIHTVKPPLVACPVELGAEFIHGRPPELLDLIAREAIATVDVEGHHLAVRNGRVSEVAGWSRIDDLLNHMRPPGGRDISFAEFLQISDAPRDVKHAAAAFVEGFNAADQHRISVRALLRQREAEQSIGGDRTTRLLGGYGRLVKALYHKLPEARELIRLHSMVTAVDWAPGRVEIHLRHGAGFALPPLTARQCIVTVPLGVLLAAPDARGAIRFSPEPPQLAAARRLAMGTAWHIVLEFRTPFWESVRGLDGAGFMDMEGDFPVWWTQAPLRAPLLTAWSAGPRADALAGKAPREIAAAAVATLAKGLGTSAQAVAEQLRSWHVHDWQSDPFSRGAYSYVPAGALDAPGELASPAANTLFFAGEASDTAGHWGTVHAARASGLRAARQALSQSFA